MSKPILCLDFDGVIHSYSSGWQGPTIVADPPVPGAMQFLLDAVEHFEIHIYSSRSHQDGIISMMKWTEKALQEHGLSKEASWRFVCDILKWPDHKPSAKVTIDDRALTFTGVWPSIADLQAFKPWNK